MINSSVLYNRDGGIAGRLKALEDRVKALESGALFPGKSVLVQAASGISGAWPSATVNFNVANPNSKIVVIWSGSLFSTVANSICSLQLKVDGSVVQTASFFVNATNTHQAVPTALYTQTGLTAGAHTAQVTLSAGSSDSNDSGFILVLELPQ